MRINSLPSVNEANVLYLVLGLGLFFIGSIAQSIELYSGLLITEYVLILIPNILYLKFRGYSLKNVLRLNKISIKQVIFTFFIIIFAYPIAVFLNYIVMVMVGTVSTSIPTGVPIPGNLNELLIGYFVIAITPGICEEVMFRGTLQRAYTSLGVKKGLIISSILFGIFHFNIFNLVGPAFLGLILGILLLKSNSIFTSILGHVFNNAIALTLGYYLTQVTDNLDQIVDQGPVIPDGIQFIATLVILGGFAVFSSIMLLLLIKKFPKTEESIIEEELVDEESVESGDIYTGEDKRITWLPVYVILAVFIYTNYKFLFF